MRKFLNKGLWISLYLLFPVTIVGLFSQNAIPGEFLYPVKLGMENVGMFVFSLTPESKASYDSTLTERRFDEAQKLIVYNSNTSGLDSLVTQAAKTQESVQNVEDPKQKEALEEKLIQDINDYQDKLTQTQQKVDPTYIQPTPTPTSTVAPTQTIGMRVEPTKTMIPVQARKINPTQNTPTPTFTPTPQTPPNIIGDIEQTKKKLEQIKHMQFQSVQMQSTTTTQQGSIPTPIIPTVTPANIPSTTFHSSSTFAPTFPPSPQFTPYPSRRHERQETGGSQFPRPEYPEDN